MSRARIPPSNGSPSGNPPPASALPSGTSRLVLGDCLALLQSLPDRCLDLIYVDPPFLTGRPRIARRDGRATHRYADAWAGGLPEYVGWLSARLTEMRRTLRETGTIYVHLDWHASHYVKVEMDRLFGYDRFLNEIAWCYNVGGKSTNRWARKHDTLLFYARSDRWWFDGKAAGVKRETGTKSFGGIIGRDEQGRRYQDKLARSSGRYYRYYLDEPKVPEDWWTDINSIQSQSRERLGWPTQKPLNLLRRIVASSCPPGGVVADFFCGSGTTLEAAEIEGRRWLGCDLSPAAVAIAGRRLEVRAASDGSGAAAATFSREALAPGAEK